MQRGFTMQWLKFYVKRWIFYLILGLRKFRTKEGKETQGFGNKSQLDAAEMDRAQKLPSEDLFPRAIDAVYLQGGSATGQYAIFSAARRQRNITQSIGLLVLPGVGTLVIPANPDSKHAADGSVSFNAGDLLIQPVVPNKQWKTTYSGKMRRVSDDVMLDVRFSLDWHAISGVFNFDTDLDSWNLAGAIAQETWSREYFRDLEKHHQTHYEQFGRFSGRIEIESHGVVQLDVVGIRDHSYGNIRDWNDIRRYVFNFCQLEDGTCINVGIISMPKSMRRMEIGYLVPAVDSDKVLPVQAVHWDWDKVGEDGCPPDEFTLRFTVDQVLYEMKAFKVEDDVITYFGDDWEGRVHDRFMKYEVNGQQGWGISEWAYRNYAGKPSSIIRKQTS